MYYPSHHRRRRLLNRVFLFLILLFIGGVTVAAWVFVSGEDDQTDVKGASQVVVDPQVAAINTKDELRKANFRRRDDAGQLGVAVKQYMNQNREASPTTFVNGQLGAGTPAKVNLVYFKTLTITAGQQAPVQGDVLRLVTNAKCAATQGATVKAAPTDPNTFVMQYSYLRQDGGWDAKCQETS